MDILSITMRTIIIELEEPVRRDHLRDNSVCGMWRYLSLNSQVEKFGPILISMGTVFRGYEFFFFKGRLIEQ